MTVVGRLLRNTENPTLPLTSTALAEWLTGASTSAGVAVTEQRVLGLPAYYRALSLTAGTLAGLPLKVYRNGTRERVRIRTVLDSPNPRQTPFEFWFTLYSTAIAWGNGYGRKVRNTGGQVAQVWPLRPSQVRVEGVDPTERDPAGKLFLVTDRAGTEHRWTSHEVFHLPYLSPDGLSGVRPLQAFRQSLGIAIAADDSAANFYANGSRISGVLRTEQTLTETQANDLKARWKKLTSGPANAGDIAVLDAGGEFKPIAIPPADAQLLESRRWSVSEVARMVGTPPHLIGDVERSTSWGTGIEEQVLGWVKFTLGQWITLSEQRVTRELLPGGWDSGSWYAEAALEGLLRGDAAARAALYHSGIVDGWLNRNEVRGYENLEPVDGLDEFIVPSNMAIIAVDGQATPVTKSGAAAG